MLCGRGLHGISLLLQASCAKLSYRQKRRVLWRIGPRDSAALMTSITGTGARTTRNSHATRLGWQLELHLGAIEVMENGTLIGDRYRIVRELGRGGMGVVYEARQLQLDRPVAIKIMQRAQNANEYARFVREARAAANVTSPHIVQIIDFSSAPMPYIVMELLSGATLEGRLRSGKMPVHEVVEFGRQLLSALALVHQAGIVHRDVKPANIFFMTNPAADARTPLQCKLLDFGIAELTKASGAPGAAGAVLGTLPYMAPEQLIGGEEVTRAADLYALGVCMFEALAGRRPTQHVQFASIVAELSQGPAPALHTLAPELHPALAAVVDRAIARAPEARFASAREMLDALESAAAALAANQPIPTFANSGYSATAPNALTAGKLAAQGAPHSTGAMALHSGLAAHASPAKSRVPLVIGAAALLAICTGIGAGIRINARNRTPKPNTPSIDNASTNDPTLQPSGVLTAEGLPVLARVPPAAATSARNVATAAELADAPPAFGSALPSASVNVPGKLRTACSSKDEGHTHRGEHTVCTHGTWLCAHDFAYRECSGSCVPVDANNCTGCGAACQLNQVCRVDISPKGGSGTCQSCAPNELACGISPSSRHCTNPLFDAYNCGRCGNQCNTSCANGVCAK